MKTNLKIFIYNFAQVLGLTFLSLTLFWALNKHIVFNELFLRYKMLKIFYYVLTTIFSLGLSAIWIIFNKKLHYFISNLILTLIGLYLFVSLFSSYGEFCEDGKNMSFKFLTIQFLLIIGNLFLILKLIIPRLNRKTILLVISSTGLVIIDFLFLWVSFSIYNNLI